MHLPARLRVPLAGLALCSAALLISACGSSSDNSTSNGSTASTASSGSVPASAIAVIGGETVARSKLTSLLTQVCVQYKAAKKACPKPGSAARKQLQASFVTQLVQQAEFDAAAKQLKVTVKQADVTSNLLKLKLQYAKGTNGKVDDAKWKKVLADNHTTQATVVENLRNGLERSAIFANLTKNVTVSDTDVQAYYAKNKKTYATPASRVVRHILVKDKALADKIYKQLATSDAQFAALAKKYTIDPGSKKNGGKLGSIQKGQTVPAFDKVAFTVVTGKVAPPVKSSYGWHIIEATADTVPATQKPLNAALTKTIRTSLLTTKKQSVANTWFTAFQKKLEKNVRYAAGMAPPKTTSTAASTAASAQTTTG
ncbi:MAG TPA: peptidylprolyl isomerase [Gaiellales bacterium]|jgi:parvulin-like peptidyl-prolyl isomerase